MIARGKCTKCGANNDGRQIVKSTIDWLIKNGLYEYFESCRCWYCKSHVELYVRINKSGKEIK